MQNQSGQMKILFACGGTGGHINPALAVAGHLKKRYPQADIRFIGNPHGMESRLVPKAGYPFIPIVIKGFYRSLSPHAVAHNVSALYHMFRSSGTARRILRGFKPDIVVGTGGYVSGPVLRTAAKMGIKTVTHESNAFPGVTTKLLARYVDKVLLAVPEAKKYFPDAACTFVVTGNPVREEILFADRETSRRELNIADDHLALLTFGGSLGAQRINEAVADVVRWYTQEKKRIHHIHATGQYGTELFPQLLRERNVQWEGVPTLDIREYIDDMPRCLAACDLVICRAGAMTLSELQAAGKASILIPSPNVAENHQYHNAMVLQNRGAAIVIEEKDVTGESLCKLLEELLDEPERLESLAKNAAKMAVVDATQRIADEILAML